MDWKQNEVELLQAFKDKKILRLISKDERIIDLSKYKKIGRKRSFREMPNNTYIIKPRYRNDTMFIAISNIGAFSMNYFHGNCGMIYVNNMYSGAYYDTLPMDSIAGEIIARIMTLMTLNLYSYILYSVSSSQISTIKILKKIGWKIYNGRWIKNNTSNNRINIMSIRHGDYK